MMVSAEPGREYDARCAGYFCIARCRMTLGLLDVRALVAAVVVRGLPTSFAENALHPGLGGVWRQGGDEGLRLPGRRTLWGGGGRVLIRNGDEGLVR